MPPPVIYLDTRDYSRFGDVLRGKAHGITEALFRDLEKRKQAGDAIFAVSMPIFGELLQYDSSFRETSICKAEAVERLCGSWALAFPSRLVAAEIGGAGRQCGLLPEGPDFEILSSDRYWYPNVAAAFENLRAQIHAGISPEIEALGLTSPKMRRAAKTLANKIDFAAAARAAAPQMALKYGLPVEVFIRSIVALLNRTVTPAQASRLLFGAIAEPVKFVETYFERIVSERTLPAWISGFGRDFEGRLTTFRETLKPHIHIDSARQHLESLLAEWPTKLAQVALSMAGDDISEIAMDAGKLDSLASDPELVQLVPEAQIVGKILPAYVRQIIGLSGQEAKIERSFGGDLVHALYLPHVDLWRGDRRFAAVVAGALPQYADRLVAKATALPAAIDAWHASKSRSRSDA